MMSMMLVRDHIDEELWHFVEDDDAQDVYNVFGDGDDGDDVDDVGLCSHWWGIMTFEEDDDAKDDFSQWR